MPFFQLEEALARTAFTRHTYGHTTMGHEKDIAAMPRMFDYSRKFFARYYRPENTILIVVGDVAPDATLALAERYWGPWKKGYVPPRIPAEPPQRQERRVEVAYPGRTLPLLTLAYKSGPFAPSSVEWVSGLVLAELWFGETSALYKQLVLDERTVQQLMAMPAMNRDPGLFQIVAQVADNRHVDAVRTALDQAIAEARTTAVDPARVREAVSRLRYGFLMGLDTPRAVAGQLAQLTAITGDVAAVEQMYRTLEQVTPDTVKSAAARLFDARRRTVAILREKQS
jgi:zinc protease